MSLLGQRTDVGEFRKRYKWMALVVLALMGVLVGKLFLLQIVHHDIAGMRLDYVFPVSTALALVPTILAAAFVAAVWPAEAAAHGSLLEALEYE